MAAADVGKSMVLALTAATGSEASSGDCDVEPDGMAFFCRGLGGSGSLNANRRLGGSAEAARCLAVVATVVGGFFSVGLCHVVMLLTNAFQVNEPSAGLSAGPDCTSQGQPALSVFFRSDHCHAAIH